MSTDTVTVTFTCTNCGGTLLELPDNYTDNSRAKCKSCGIDVGRYGDIKARAMAAVKAKVTEDFRQIFKDKKRWKVG
jgi:hypothetical protein